MENITLFPHQVAGAAFLAERNFAGLFFGMGTGKTLASLEALNRSDANRLLVIAPPIALPMWKAEIQSYLDLRDDEVQILKTGKTPINTQTLVVSYNIATTRSVELREWLREDCSAMICDESHALKNASAKRTKNILGKGGIVEGAFYSWMLTGTPITRWNDDMFPFLVRGDAAGMKRELGGLSLEKYQLRYTIRQQRQFAGARWPTWMTVGNRNTEQLAEWIYSDLAMRVDLEEVFKSMPPLTTRRYEIGLDFSSMPELKAELKEMERHSIAEIAEKLKSKEPALASVRRKIGLAKVKAFAKEVAERVESGQNILVGAWHTDVIDELTKELGRLLKSTDSVRSIDGRVGSTKRETIVEQWNGGMLKVLVGQIAAMGVSLNLQDGGSQIMVIEEDWSPAVMDQFYARLWRYGQKRHVHVDILESKTKIDKALSRISGTKARSHDQFNQIGREMANGV